MSVSSLSSPVVSLLLVEQIGFSFEQGEVRDPNIGLLGNRASW